MVSEERALDKLDETPEDSLAREDETDDTRLSAAEVIEVIALDAELIMELDAEAASNEAPDEAPVVAVTAPMVDSPI